MMRYGFSTSPYIKRTDIVQKWDTSKNFVYLTNNAAGVYCAGAYRPRDRYHDQKRSYGFAQLQA